MTKSRNIAPPRHVWTAADLAYMREHYADTPTAQIAQALGVDIPRVYAAAHHHGLCKSHTFLTSTASGRIGRYGGRGAEHQFRAGQEPWNKGVPGSTGLHPNSVRCHYTPGNVNGRAAQLVQPLGALRISSDGILERKTATAPGPNNRRWTPVHRLVWMAAHGPVPAGRIVVFKPGRKSTDLDAITPDALELVTRAENMRRNSVHSKYPPELARLVQLRGALNRVINRKAKEAETT